MGWGWLRDAFSIGAGAAGVAAWRSLTHVDDLPDLPPNPNIDAFDVNADARRNRSWMESAARSGYRADFLIGPRGIGGPEWDQRKPDYSNPNLWPWAQTYERHRNPAPPGGDGENPMPDTPPILDPNSPSWNPNLPQRKAEDLDPLDNRRNRRIGDYP